MKIIYKCRCMKDETEIDVPDRRQTGDLGDWMNAVGHCISADHRALKPSCGIREMEYMKVPMPENAPGIGMAPKLDPNYILDVPGMKKDIDSRQAGTKTGITPEMVEAGVDAYFSLTPDEWDASPHACVGLLVSAALTSWTKTLPRSHCSQTEQQQRSS